MKKVGNKGFTIIEILVSFVLVMIILMNMFTIVLNYQNTANEEELRTDYITFQAIVTKDIQTDIISKELVSIEQVLPASSCGSSIDNCIELTFQDGDKKRFFVYNNLNNPSEARNKYIQYGEQKYRIRDDIIPDSEIPSGKTAYDYQTINVWNGNLFQKQQIGNVTIYSINVGIEVLSLKEEYGIHIVAPVGLY